MSGVLSGASAIGACLHVGGSVAIVAGQTVVKVAQLVEETSQQGKGWTITLRSGQDPPVWKSPDGRWRRQWVGSKAYAAIGWTVFTIGNILRFAAMRFTAQMVAAGLGSLQFVVIPIVSHAFLGQPYEWSTFFSICVVLFGNMLIICYGPAEVSFSLSDLRRLWHTTSMIAFVVIVGMLLACMHCAVLYLNRRKAARAADVRAQWRAKAKKEAPLDTFVHAFLFSARAAFVGAWSVMFSKSLTYVLSAPWPSQFEDWYSYFVVAAFLGSAAAWIRSTNAGLHQFSSSLIIPLMQAWWMALAIVTGGVYFHEFDSMPETNVMALVFGMLLAIGGALAMGCSAFLSEQHAMISYVILPPEQEPALQSGLALPAMQDPTTTASAADWQHNMAALQHRISQNGDAEMDGTAWSRMAPPISHADPQLIHITANSGSSPHAWPDVAPAGKASSMAVATDPPWAQVPASTTAAGLQPDEGALGDATPDVHEGMALVNGEAVHQLGTSWQLEHIGDLIQQPSLLAQLQHNVWKKFSSWKHGYQSF